MKIKYLGHSCFQLETEKGVKIVTDPYTKVGYELEKGLKADIVTVSHGHFDHAHTEAVEAKTVLSTAGRFVLEGVEIEGIESFHDPVQGRLRGKNIVYKLRADGMTACHLGDLGEPCSQEILDRLGKVDVLFLPVGGTYTIDAAQAKEYIEMIKPKIAIPMHYRPVDGTIDITEAEEFLRLFDEKDVTAVKNGEYELRLGTLEEEMPILYMERAGK